MRKKQPKVQGLDCKAALQIHPSCTKSITSNKLKSTEIPPFPAVIANC